LKKLALFAIIVLIFGTMSPSLVNHAYGQNDPSILLRIAVQADKQIVNQLDKKYENKMPNNINILYDKGHRAVKSLDQSLSNNDIEKAKQDFLLAMNSFMQISRIISQSSEKVVVNVPVNTNQNFESKIDRIEKYVKTLESVSQKHNKIDQNKDEFTKAYSLIKEIRNQINSNENPSDNISELNNLMNSIKKEIRNSIAEKHSKTIKNFFEKFLPQIDQKLMEAKDLDRDQIGIDKANELILEIRELLSKNQINDAKKVYSELKVVLKDIGISVKIT
jgi:exonuclease VII small subunit